MKHQFATVLLGPVLLAQGLWTRKRTPRLPEADGPRRGMAGSGTALRLLVVGDSAAAGVGAEHQGEALVGCLVAELAKRFRVQWTLEAETGATTATTLERLAALEAQTWDAAVTSLGVNDVTSALGLEDWVRQQRQLRHVLREVFGVAQLIISGLPPVWGFPALPQPLRWYLGGRAIEFDAALAVDIEGERDTVFLRSDFATDANLMAVDGFHPGPEIYRQWARQAAAAIR